jgi:hypothetical protein
MNGSLGGELDRERDRRSIRVPGSETAGVAFLRQRDVAAVCEVFRWYRTATVNNSVPN